MMARLKRGSSPTKAAFLRGSTDVDIAVRRESLGVSGISQRLELVQPAQSRRFEARLRRIGVKNQRFDLDANNAMRSVDPLRDLCLSFVPVHTQHYLSKKRTVTSSARSVDRR